MDPIKIDTSALPWWITALFVVIGALATVVVFLFKRSDRRDKAIQREREDMVKERNEWSKERERLRAEAAEEYAKRLEAAFEAAKEREDSIRREFIDVSERSATEAARAASETTKVLDKIYDRFLGPRHRGY